MSEQPTLKVKFETWEQAYAGLSQTVRQQNSRIAAYTQAIFLQACKGSMPNQTPEAKVQLKEDRAELAYKCGLYHQLGKCLVPEQYQQWQPSYTPEEVALYQKYTINGRLLVSQLQQRAANPKEKPENLATEQKTKNIPWLMLRTTCEQHMERWDGTGYPNAYRGVEISPIAQIVSIAKVLDEVSTQIKSEHPFEDALAEIAEQRDITFNALVVDALQDSAAECKALFEKYIYYTKAVPKTIPLLTKRPERPMGLQFRPIRRAVGAAPLAYEAVPWFGLEHTIETLEDALIRTDLLKDLVRYFLYEATDAMYRMANCALAARSMVFAPFAPFYHIPSAVGIVGEVVDTQHVEPTSLVLGISLDQLLENNAVVQDNLSDLKERHFPLLLSGYQNVGFTLAQVRQAGFTYLSIAPALHGTPEGAALITVAQHEGLVVLATQVNDEATLAWFSQLQGVCLSGVMVGALCSEDELIEEALAHERMAQEV